MPGPVSDSYDPEFGTGANAAEIRDAITDMYDRLTGLLGGAPPMQILKLIDAELPRPIPATLTEKEWRLLRFCCERANDSI